MIDGRPLSEFVMSIDLETSHLPPDGIPLGDPQYPWMMEFGLELFHISGTGRCWNMNSLVEADGRIAHPAAKKVHGITERDTVRAGQREIIALGSICGWAKKVGFVTGFNLDFDQNIVLSALILHKRSSNFFIRPGVQFVDLLKPSQAMCKIPSGWESGEYRWPSLAVAMRTIVGEENPVEEKHEAKVGAEQAKRLFLALHQRRILEVG